MARTNIYKAEIGIRNMNTEGIYEELKKTIDKIIKNKEMIIEFTIETETN